MHQPRKLIAFVVAVLTVLGTTTSVASAARPLIDLRGAATDSYEVDSGGTARLVGEVTGRPFGGAYVATLAAGDGTLPVPGQCEPATATLQVDGPRRKHLDLGGSGQVCGLWTDATYVVTHRFTGIYQVTASSRRRLVGTDGWLSLVLATEGRAGVEVFDS
ncbi:hypothetical protein [Nocardioides coralli]|uniref:hypothetical protein n=1 Tax=Nocardioides coralli TaxID=2872154 RepID=UPI001CA44A1B|nr:hypothetical protein [Nocardioides coralli]QZY29119.1 hypothetical protein K6T13_17100 [Nocardioides coralli]